jgi:hypothetical protein
VDGSLGGMDREGVRRVFLRGAVYLSWDLQVFTMGDFDLQVPLKLVRRIRCHKLALTT